MDCGFDCEVFKNYHVDVPYPEAEIHGQNLYYAGLISDTFAGKGSESTAIAQYSTHRFFIAAYPDVDTAYKYIPAVEMIHWNILGGLVKALGANPTLFSGVSKQFWNGKYPDYRYTLKQILESDIEGEKGAIAHYTRLTRQVSNLSLQEIFQRIILDEKRHVEVLTGLYDKYFGNVRTEY